VKSNGSSWRQRSDRPSPRYTPSVRIAVLAAAAGAVVLVADRFVLANGRLPASSQIVVSPTDPNTVVLRATFGILLSHDGGATWQWLCEDVLGIASTSSEDPALALTAGGSLIAGVSGGLAVSSDSGCNWRFVGAPLSQEGVKDVTVRPDNPHVALALASTYDRRAADGGPGYRQQVYETTDDGANWAALGVPVDPTALATALEISATDGGRVYVSAMRDGGQSASLFVTTDRASTWTERPVPIDPSQESGVYIAGVDPMSAQRVYLRTAGSTSRLLVTDDAGLSYRATLSLAGQMAGFALSTDGSTVYAGNADQGLFAATRDQLSFQNVSTRPIQCLATQGAGLWACSRDNKAGTGFIAGVSNDGGATFSAKLHLAVQPPIACAAGATAAQCAGDPQQTYCQLLQGCHPDAGAGTSESSASTKACGCSSVGRHAAGLFPVAAAAALAGVAASKRRNANAAFKRRRKR
jgi:photosystem II stability/assembly factor-like uncharacterized protein